MSERGEFAFFKDEDKLIRAEFINSERREVEEDVRFAFGITIGILFTSFVLSLIRTEIIGSRVNRIIFALFMLFPLLILGVIWTWNQDYYFDALGIKLVLAIMMVLEIISTTLYVIEVAGTGTRIPRPSNDSLAISLYLGALVAITIGFVLIIYALIQTEEHPGIPLLKSSKEETEANITLTKEQPTTENIEREAQIEIKKHNDATDHAELKPPLPTSRPRIIDELAKKSKSKTTRKTKKKTDKTKTKKGKNS